MPYTTLFAPCPSTTSTTSTTVSSTTTSTTAGSTTSSLPSSSSSSTTSSLPSSTPLTTSSLSFARVTSTSTITIPYSDTSIPSPTSSAATTNLNGGDVSNVSTSSPVGGIVGGVIGGLVGLAVVAALVWFCCFKGKRSGKDFEFSNEDEDPWSPSAVGAGGVGGVARQATRRRTNSHDMDAYSDNYQSPSMSRGYNDEPDYYSSTSMQPRAMSIAQAGRAGVGIQRALSGREPEREQYQERDPYGGMADEGMGQEGGYGVASQLAPRSSYGHSPYDRQRQSDHYPEGYQLSPVLATSASFQSPGTNYQDPIYQEQHPSAPAPRFAAASPVPSHRSLPALGAVFDDESPRRGGPLRVTNEERFSGSHNAYSDLTAGL